MEADVRRVPAWLVRAADDPPSSESIHGLGTRKNDPVLDLIRHGGVDVYPGSVRFVEAVRAAGLRRGVVSASKNCREVLMVTGIEHVFEVRADDLVAEQTGLRGKPAPDMFLVAATALGVDLSKSAVFEDAIAGVQAGRAGAFAWVIGVDRVGQAGALRLHGADLVVTDLGEVLERHDRAGRVLGEPWAFAEPSLRGYSYPEQGQSLINVTNGKLLRLLVDDEPFDARYGTLMRHEPVLDLRAGVLLRMLEWVSPAGKAVRVGSTRLVSFVQGAVGAICYEVKAVEEPARVVVQSSLVANDPVPEQADDPRSAAALRAPLVAVTTPTTISRPHSGTRRVAAACA